MPSFVCKNKKCKDFDKEKFFVKVKIKANANGVFCSEQICNSCQQKMEDVKEPDSGYTKYMGGGENVCKK